MLSFLGKSRQIFHCCPQKTASQWFVGFYRDPIFARTSGLQVVEFVRHLEGLSGIPDYRSDLQFYRLANTRLAIERPMPRNSIGVPFYVGYETYRAIPKRGSVKAIYVQRDPRDLLVSAYYSARDTHPEMPVMMELRAALRGMNLQDGLLLRLRKLQEAGLFEAMRSWNQAAESDPGITILRYEDLASDYERFVENLLEVMGVKLGTAQKSALCAAHRFENYRREPADRPSHYRKGRPGDWRSHFDDKLMDAFREIAGDLVNVLGYGE